MGMIFASVTSSVKSVILISHCDYFCVCEIWMQWNLLRNRKNWKQCMFQFLSALSALMSNLFPSFYRLILGAVCISSNSFHICSSTPGVQILTPFLWRNCFLHVTGQTCGWNWPLKTVVLWHLLDLRPLTTMTVFFFAGSFTG